MVIDRIAGMGRINAAYPGLLDLDLDTMNEIEAYRFTILHDPDPIHAAQVGKLSLSLFDQLRDIHACGENERTSLLCAAYLHDIGMRINEQKHHVHSYRIVMNADFPSFTLREKQIVANIARYHRKSFPSMKHSEFAILKPSDRQTVEKMSALLRIADALDYSHEMHVKDIACSIQARRCVCVLSSDTSCVNEKTQVSLEKELFVRVYGLDFIIVECQPQIEAKSLKGESSLIPALP